MITRLRPVRAAALALVALTGGCAPSLKVMTYNVRYASDDGPQPWPSRRAAAVAMLRRVHPDVIGTQELLQRQGDDMVAALPEYRWFGRDRMGGHANEHMGILYRTDRLRLVQQGDFWLSDTPDQPGSGTRRACEGERKAPDQSADRVRAERRQKIQQPQRLMAAVTRCSQTVAL